MSNKRSLNKLLPVWLAVSAVFLIAGIILLCLLNFNYAAEKGSQKTIEVEYGVVTQTDENAEAKLRETCDNTLKGKGAFNRVEVQVDEDSFSPTVPKKIVYSFSGDISDTELSSLVDALKTATASYAETDDDFWVMSHTVEVQTGVHFDSYWRGALAIGVAVFVALIYVGVRFGVGSALTGLAVCAHDATLCAALLAITRIPVYFYSPLIYVALAALVSVILWILQCVKMKENFKNPEFAAYTADEAIERTRKENWKLTVIFAGGLGAVALVAGAIATAGSRLFFLPVLLPVLLPLYSSLILGPALHVHVKTAMDKLKEKFGKNKGKKKTVKAVETES